jgi:hypothetical protein
VFSSAASSPAPQTNFADYFLKLITVSDTDVALSISNDDWKDMDD